MLIDIDFVDSCDNTRPVEAEDDETDNNARLIAEYRPAEMYVTVECYEAAHADCYEDEPSRHRRPHPRLD